MEAGKVGKDSRSRWDLNQPQWMGDILIVGEKSFYT